MRIVVSSARAALEQDMQTTREKETAIEHTISTLDLGIDGTMLSSDSYMATADLLSRVLLPTAYSIHKHLRERIEAGQRYESALNALSSMDIWDMDEILRSQEDAARVYQTVCDIRDRNTDPNEYEFLCELCEAERQKLQYWESKKNLFETFLSNTSSLYNGYATDIVPLYNALRNTRFEYNTVSGVWSIDGLSVESYLNFNGSTINRELVVEEFERMHPDLAKDMQLLYDKTISKDFFAVFARTLTNNRDRESELFNEETWLEFRYLLYTAPVGIRNIYISNIENLSVLRNDGQYNNTYYNSGDKGIVVDNYILNSGDYYMQALFHELGHGVNDSNEGFGFLTDEKYFDEKAYVKDVKQKFYSIALETIERYGRHDIEDDETWISLKDQKAQEYVQTVIQAGRYPGAKNKAEKLLQFDSCFAEAVKTYNILYTDNPLASDISGAATANILNSGWQHSMTYWRMTRIVDPSRANNEGFADYLAAIATRNYKVIHQMQVDFPHSTELYENAIKGAAENLNTETYEYRE